MRDASADDTAFMRLALELAAEAAAAGEVPVGAVVVRQGVVIGRGRNRPIETHDPSAHAEMQALREAAAHLGNYRLDQCTLYVTLEPCAMCSGAMLHARLQHLVFGASDPKTGCAGSVLDLFAEGRLNHQTTCTGGLLAEPASAMLQDFFRERREHQRQLAVPLREDALRTPERRFAHLVRAGWIPRYASDLPCLGGLRLHYLDEGPADAARTTLILHPVPGWSQCMLDVAAERLGEGDRVVVPDLIGFGRSDKPKREDFHTPDFHVRCLAELVQHLDLQAVTLLAPCGVQWLAEGLRTALPGRIHEVLVLPYRSCEEPVLQGTLDTPYPDAGHRAAERAFAKLGLLQTTIQP